MGLDSLVLCFESESRVGGCISSLFALASLYSLCVFIFFYFANGCSSVSLCGSVCLIETPIVGI